MSSSEYHIELLPDGSFECEDDQILQIQSLDKISFYLDSKIIQTHRPMLLTGYPRKIEDEICYPDCKEIKQETVLKDPQLSQQYNVFEGSFNKEYQWQCDIQLGDFNGTFFCQVIFVDYKDNQSKPMTLNIRKFSKPQYLIIQPRISINNKPIMLEQLVVQTQYTYCLGHINRWEQVLQNQANIGYNAFHFLPIQQLGNSKNMFAIKDQNCLDHNIIPNSDIQILSDKIKQIENQMGALSFIDIILNNTSSDSTWILKIPQAIFSKNTTPFLRPALQLDIALQQFSTKFGKGEYQKYYSKANIIENEDDLDKVLDLIEVQVFHKIKLWEYFEFDVQEVEKEFRQQIKQRKLKIVERDSDIQDDDHSDFLSKEPHQKLLDILINQKQVSEFGQERYKLQLNLDQVIKEIIKNSYSYSFQSFNKAISQLFLHYQEKGKKLVKTCLANIKKSLLIKINSKQQTMFTQFPYQLIPRYFTQLANGTYAANDGIHFKIGQEYDGLIDINSYLDRSMNIYQDLIKLNYGPSKKYCPELWKQMRQYIRSMAKIFHGFRIDNAFSTPLHVGEYFIRKARNINKNIIVFAELFQDDKTKDALFCKRFGINAVVRNTLSTKTATKAIQQLYEYGKGNENAIGSLEPMQRTDLWTNQDKIILKPTYPNNIVFDYCKEKQTCLEKFGLRQCLSNIGIFSFANFFKGTLRGFDELNQHLYTKSNEKRLYQQEIQGKQQWIYQDKKSIGIYIKSNHNYNNVQLKGSFNEWSDAIQLNKVDDHFFACNIEIPQTLQSFEYKFIINHGEWICDPTKPIKNGNNYYEVNQKIDNKIKLYKNLSQIRRILNEYNKKMAVKYPESEIKQHGQDIISIMRQQKNKNKSYILISRLALEEKNQTSSEYVNFNFVCPGYIQEIKQIFYIPKGTEVIYPNEQDYEFLPIGESSILKTMNINQFADIYKDPVNKTSVMQFFNMPPGAVFVIKCSPNTLQLKSLTQLNILFSPSNQNIIKKTFLDLEPDELNYILFRCEKEEQFFNSKNTYEIPDCAQLPFAGFAGLFSEIENSSKQNNLNTKLFQNLREGNWLMDYLLDRIKNKTAGIDKIYEIASQFFEQMKNIQRFNIPYFFCKFIRLVRVNTFQNILQRVKLPLESYVQSNFQKMLLVASYQFISRIKITENFVEKEMLSMSSGLPEYSVEPNRMHGRDVFMSFKGLVLIPGLYQEAKELILYFGSLLRHGLIPNIINDRGKPRYNNRDVCWWFIKAIRDYLEFSQDYEILEQKIKMQYLSNDQESHNNKVSLGIQKYKTLQEIIQEIFQSHVTGINFKEWDAGKYLDSNMEALGFHINLSYDEKSGFIIGGNSNNALTWMNVIGQSQRANNKGLTASPRDGAPIELTALLWICLNFISELYEQDKYPVNTVIKKNKEEIMFCEWAEQIQDNFEQYYCVPANKSKTLGLHSSKQFVKSKIKKRRYGFYKDTVLSSSEEQENQLRPNACIAISLAPELFSNENNKEQKIWTLQYLASVEHFLIGPHSLGVKTLEAEDRQYADTYDKYVDSHDEKKALGFNLHNGTEWVFLYGFFVKSMMQMHLEEIYNNQRIMSYLTFHKKHILNNPWQSFPGITNRNGQECLSACPSRALSVAQISEVCYELSNHDYLNEIKDNINKNDLDQRWKQSSRDIQNFWLKKTNSSGSHKTK